MYISHCDFSLCELAEDFELLKSSPVLKGEKEIKQYKMYFLKTKSLGNKTIKKMKIYISLFTIHANS